MPFAEGYHDILLDQGGCATRRPGKAQAQGGIKPLNVSRVDNADGSLCRLTQAVKLPIAEVVSSWLVLQYHISPPTKMGKAQV